MLYGIIFLLLMLTVYAPQLWVHYVMRKHRAELSDLPGTGGELAQHLVNRFELTGVQVEETQELGDHYDPQLKAVRLCPQHYNGKSLTAIAVAAHEVGHAIQYARNERVSQLRAKYIPFALKLKRLGVLLLTLGPLIAPLVGSPRLMLLFVPLGVMVFLISASMYLFVLPEEWDASFYKALPMLIHGNYIKTTQIKATRSILRAAALTYFAAALAETLSLWRWIAIIKGMR